MKILLISGHGAGDPGAAGNGYKEADLTREVVNLMKDKLEKYAQVDVYNQARNAYYDVNKGNVAVNFANYNYVFEVHFNAGGGKGTEIYVTREEKATTVEQKIMDKLSKFFVVRGVKRKNFNVIASAKRKGVSSALLETCFIDNAQDMQTYQANKNEIAKSIVEAIAEGFGLKNDKKSDLQYQVHLQDLGWQNIQNANEGAGTEGQSRRLEAVKFFGNNGLQIKYRAHVQDIGWQDWKNNGEIAGTTGEGRRLEAIEIECSHTLEVQEHVQDIGWMPKFKSKNFVIGTVGKSLRLEAFKINVIG